MLGILGVIKLTFAVENFFSVPVTAPLRWAALSALLPLMVVSRFAVPGPRTLLPILVTLSQSWSAILLVLAGFFRRLKMGCGLKCRWLGCGEGGCGVDC